MLNVNPAFNKRKTDDISSVNSQINKKKNLEKKYINSSQIKCQIFTYIATVTTFDIVSDFDIKQSQSFV